MKKSTMYKRDARKVAEESVEIANGWDRAIAETRKKIKRLETAISVFQERKNAGEAWPAVD